MITTSRKFLTPLATAAFLGVLLIPSSAGASSTPAISSGSTSSGPPAGAVVAPLTTTTATAVVNLGNGTSDVTFSNGQTIVLPTGVASKLVVHASGVSPENTVYGNCGSSFLYLEPNSSIGVWGYTGYQVLPSVIGEVFAYDWQVQSENATYDKFQTNQWDGPTSSYEWVADYYVSYGYGDYLSSVVYGYVIGTSGVCYSGDPKDTFTT
jgi:hypothetical protein